MGRWDCSSRGSKDGDAKNIPTTQLKHVLISSLLNWGWCSSLLNWGWCHRLWQLREYWVWMSQGPKISSQTPAKWIPWASVGMYPFRNLQLHCGLFSEHTAWSVATSWWTCLISSERTTRFTPTLLSEHTVRAHSTSKGQWPETPQFRSKVTAEYELQHLYCSHWLCSFIF